MRNLSLCMVAQKGWQLEGLDLQTGFLQTGKTEEAREIWTYGVPELKQALGAEEHEVLRILKNVYGNSTAPRGLWEDVDRTFTKLGGKRILGDSSFWVWTRPNPNPRNEGDQFETIGFVGGHSPTSTEPATVNVKNGSKSARRSTRPTSGERSKPRSTATL